MMPNSYAMNVNRYPELIINKYVWKQFELNKEDIYAQYSGMPILPVRDLEGGTLPWGNKPYIVYDSFMKARTTNKYFYPIKTAQMMYSIKGSIAEIYEWRDFISNVLDREDDAAHDINQYAGQNLYTESNPGVLSFHCINTSQVNYIGNTTEKQGQRKDYSANLVIKYDYHITDIYNNS